MGRRGEHCSAIAYVFLRRQTARMSKTSQTTPPSPVVDFESSLDELEGLVQRLEKGDLSLDDSLKAYEQGIGLFRRCQTALQEAELRVRLLTDAEDPASASEFPDVDAP